MVTKGNANRWPRARVNIGGSDLPPRENCVHPRLKIFFSLGP